MTNPNQPQPIIDAVPGMATFDESQLPSRGVVPIPNEAVTPAMMNHAIGSPYNQLGGGRLEKPAAASEQGGEAVPAAQHVGGTALEAAGMASAPVDAEAPAPEQSENRYATLLDPDHEAPVDVEAAAVRPKRPEFTVAQENEQRMNLARAIRQQEEEQGLPHTRDLR